MAFKPLEYLEQGKVEFMYDITPYDEKTLVNWIRESKRRKEIVASFLPKLINKLPYFCFDVIYDMEEYKEETKKLLKKYYKEKIIDKEHLINLLNNSSLGIEYLSQNFDNILETYQKNLDFIFDYLFDNFNKCIRLLKMLSIHKNLHIRFLFMSYLVQNHKNKISVFYDDITKYLTSVTYKKYEQTTFLPVFMSMEDVSELANYIFETNDYELYQKFKEFILKNYKYNNLGSILISPKIKKNRFGFELVKNSKGINEFNCDPDFYFKTVATNRLEILKNYSKKISIELLEIYKRQLEYFKKNGVIDESYEHLDIYGLTRFLDEYVSKYLDLSQDKTYEYISEGTTASCYRIGDFVFKLIKTKWSYEDVICPNLYLILPNLEEILLRDSRGIVKAGIEVQKYLKKSSKNVPDYVLAEFHNELKRLGYFLNDTLINGECGDNTRLLDDYHEVGNETVPDWFKKYPLVLVDRDRIYKAGNTFIKQQRTEY